MIFRKFAYLDGLALLHLSENCKGLEGNLSRDYTFTISPDLEFVAQSLKHCTPAISLVFSTAEDCTLL